MKTPILAQLLHAVRSSLRKARAWRGSVDLRIHQGQRMAMLERKGLVVPAQRRIDVAALREPLPRSSGSVLDALLQDRSEDR